MSANRVNAWAGAALWCVMGVVVLPGMLVGCGGSGGPGGNTVGSEGGTVVSAGGEVSLVFPANAVAQTILVGITEGTSVPVAPTGLGVVPTTCYDFAPDGAQFAQPVTLTVRYTQAGLPSGVSESSLALYRVAGQTWQVVSGSAVDTTADTVTAPITSFSTYGILGSTLPPVVVAIVGADPVQLSPGATHQFSATVTGTDNTAVTWAASGGTISASGLYTAPEASGTYTVTAQSQANPTSTDSVQVDVSTGDMHVIVN